MADETTLSQEQADLLVAVVKAVMARVFPGGGGGADG